MSILKGQKSALLIKNMNESAMNPIKKYIPMKSLSLIALLVAALLAFPGSAWSAQAPTSAKRAAQSKKALALELYRTSGLQTERRILLKMKVPTATFTDPDLLRSLGFSNDHIDMVNSVYRGTFQANEFFRAKLKRIKKDFHRRHIRKAIGFFRTSTGKRIVRQEHNYWKHIGRFEKFIEQIPLTPPSRARILLVDRLEKARSAVNFDFENKASMLRVLDPLNEKFHTPDAESLIARMRTELRSQRRSMQLLEELFRYKNLSDKDLKKAVRFYESKTGKWFSKVDQKGHADGLALMNRQATRRLNNLMNVMDSGEKDFAMIKTVFSPGLRYLFSNKRDPFEPLVILPEPILIDDTAAAMDDGRFGEELEQFEFIPLELYRRVRNIDPALYNDLEFYAALFKDRKELRSLSEADYREELANYQALIAKANQVADEQARTPLQAKLDNLKMAGVIWDRSQIAALVETPDGHGHIIRVGSLLGPNYGSVESIDREKIVIVERVRDFEGNIISVTQVLEIGQP